MFKRYLQLTPFYDEVSDTGGGGSTDNSGGVSGAAEAAANGGVSSGSASASLIAAATASESSTEKPVTTTGAAEELVDLTAEARASAAATGQPKAGEETATGPVPLDRHTAAVRNARTAGADEARKEYAGLSPTDVRQMASLVVPMLRDRAGFLTRMAGEMGFTLAKKGEAAAARTEPYKLPEGILKAEDGSTAYSSKQMQEILTNVVEDLKKELKGEMKPLFDFKDTNAQRELKAQLQEQAQTESREILTDMRGRPYFQTKNTAGEVVDHPKILGYLQAIPAEVRVRNPRAAVMSAYQTFMEKDVLPSISNRARADVTADNRRKAAANVGVHPTGSNGAPPAKREIRDGDVSALAKRMEEMSAGSV